MASKEKIASLTGIRGLAAIWVVLFHFSPMTSNFLGVSAPSMVIPFGYLGVDLFFMLSGYVLGLSYSAAFLKSVNTTFWRFWIGRLFRIMPLHWFVMLTMAALILAWPSELATVDRNLPNFIASFFLVQNWGLGSPWAWNWPTWSLSAEMVAYIAFPLIVYSSARFVPRGRAANIWAACLCLALMIAVFLTIGRPNLGATGYLGLPRCVLEFAAGFFLYRAVRDWKISNMMPDQMLLAGCLITAVCISIPGLSFAVPFGFALIILACAFSGRLANLLFANTISKYLGEISYSVYLTHSVLLVVLEALIRAFALQDLAPTLRLVFVLSWIPLLLMISTLTWRLLELPGRRLGYVAQTQFAKPDQARRKMRIPR